MFTISIDHSISDKTVKEIINYIDEVSLRDVNWNGAIFKIIRGDFNGFVDGADSPEASNLMYKISKIIDDFTN